MDLSGCLRGHHGRPARTIWVVLLSGWWFFYRFLFDGVTGRDQVVVVAYITTTVHVARVSFRVVSMTIDTVFYKYHVRRVMIRLGSSIDRPSFSPALCSVACRRLFVFGFYHMLERLLAILKY
jgi:hypothetical protein